MSMSMGTSANSAIANLPLTDPGCRSESCKAFKAAHAASQAQISWASQFLYGHYVVWFYCGLIGLFTVRNAWRLSFQRGAGPASITGVKPNVVDKMKAAGRLVSYRRFKGLLIGMPSAGVLFLTGLSSVAATAMTFAQHPYYRDFRGYGSPPLAVRTGLMAAALIPLIIVLGGKVNLITMLTGVSYEKLNVWHRYVGWLMFVLSTVHTIPFFVQESNEGILATKFYSPNALEFSGTPAWALCIGLVLFSLPIVRRTCYEVFFWFHWMLAVAFLGLSFWHFYNEGDSWDYLWATMALWLLQIALRAFGKMKIFELKGDWFSSYPAVFQVMPDDMIRLDVAVPSHLKWKPGQHVFLRFPRLNPFDNHPFTVASVSGNANSTSKAGSHNTMTFLVRAHTGGTRKIADYLAITADADLNAVIEGPYGSVNFYQNISADRVILVAAGNGISSCLPWLTYLTLAMRSQSCRVQHVKLIWMIKKEQDTRWIAREIDNAVGKAPTDSLRIDIYVTGDAPSISRSDSQEEAGVKEMGASVHSRDRSINLLDCVNVKITHRPRPSLQTLIPSMVGSAGRTAIHGCGPDSFKADLSNVVAGLQKRVLSGELQEISLETETFHW